ncbi:MAG: Crp/Fnr family transcriptional regulator [Ignavibacteriae bacterium]|nr:MAG: Crp/Fnr family transcriptional regulator [Ignavibacteriota bacterium]
MSGITKQIELKKDINWLLTKKNNAYSSIIKKSPLCEIINQSAEKSIITVLKNEFLFHQDEKPKGIYFIISGKVKIVKKENQPYPAILYLVKPGDILGMHAVIDDHGHTNSAVALVDTLVCFIPAKEFLEIVASSNKNMLVVMQHLCSRIDHIENKINSRTDKSASQRFAELLLLLVDTYGTTDKNTIRVELNIEELASLTGTSKGYLSKIVSEFSQKDLILFKNNGIRILDIPALKQIAGV